MTIEQAEALDLICHYAKEYLKDESSHVKNIFKNDRFLTDLPFFMC